MKDDGIVRTAFTGANRNSAIGKVDYEGAISPIVTQAYGEFIERHAILPDGTKRSNDNWQNLFGTYDEHKEICIKSAYRHFLDLLLEHDGFKSREGIDEALGGLMFNIQAYWFAILKEKIEKDKLQKVEDECKLHRVSPLEYYNMLNKNTNKIGEKND